jgi:hypothetical protein
MIDMFTHDNKPTEVSFVVVDEIVREQRSSDVVDVVPCSANNRIEFGHDVQHRIVHFVDTLISLIDHVEHTRIDNNNNDMIV